MMLKVLIDRAKWRRGGNTREKEEENPTVSTQYGNTQLLNGYGMMCCLGFCSVALGAEKADIMNVGTPDSQETLDPAPPISPLTYVEEGEDDPQNTQFSWDAMIINDDPDLTEEERECELAALGKDNGVNFVFKGETPEDYWL